MADHGSGGNRVMTGKFLHRDILVKLAKPTFHRFRCDAATQERILDAVKNDLDARDPRATQDSRETERTARAWLVRETGRHILLPMWVDALNRSRGPAEAEITLDDLDDDLFRVRRQLDQLQDGAPRRVYHTLSALDHCATIEDPTPTFEEADKVVSYSRSLLAMERSTVDQNKRRALSRVIEGTCFALMPPRVADLHLLVLPLAEPLRAAARQFLDVRRACEETETALEDAHVKANEARRVYTERCRNARTIWTDHLAQELDAAGVLPRDVLDALAARLRLERCPPERIPELIDERWSELGLKGHVRRETRWRGVMQSAPRPRTAALQIAWRSFAYVFFRGSTACEALEELIREAEKADDAHRTWTQAAEDPYHAMQRRPAKLKDAIESFHRALDAELLPAAKQRGQR
jgi:hypothetical protein